MKVCYDKNKDIVSIYFEDKMEGKRRKTPQGASEDSLESSNIYNTEAAANLILDTVDIVSKGFIIGFRVFNASKYYDRELLNVADMEILDSEEISNKPLEKVIATITKEGILN